MLASRDTRVQSSPGPPGAAPGQRYSIIIIDIYIIYDNNNNNNYMYLTSLPHSGAGAGPPRSHSQLTLLRRLPRPQVREHWIVDNVKIGLNSAQLHNCSVISYK